MPFSSVARHEEHGEEERAGKVLHVATVNASVMNRYLLLGALLTQTALLTTATGCSFLPGFGTPKGSSGASGPSTPPPPKEDPRFEHSVEELDAFVAEHTEGYEAAGDELTGSLDSFEPWDIEMERGKCYRLVIRLDEGAAFGEHARRGVAFKYTSPGKPTVNGGPGVHGPGAVASGGCPQTDRTATFDMIANWGSATNKSRIHELGSGGFTAQLFTRDISEKELAERKADAERQAEESRRFAEEQRRKEEERRREREARREQERNNRGSSSSRSTPSGPKMVSVSIKNECRQTVKLFYGKKPKFGSGTYSSLGSNTRTSKSMKEGDMIWLVDDKQNGIGAVSISSATRNVEILRSCSGIVSK